MILGSITGQSIGGTVVAAIIAFVVFTIVAMFVGFLIALGDTVFTVMRPGIIGFFAAIAGAVAGVSAARASCDAIVRSYHSRAVFVMFAAIAAAGICYELAVLPFGWGRLAPVAQMAVTAAGAWELFWKSTENHSQIGNL